MKFGGYAVGLDVRRPPHGGRGLKSAAVVNNQVVVRRPPHGGRGLKFALAALDLGVDIVAPRTGGVD